MTSVNLQNVIPQTAWATSWAGTDIQSYGGFYYINGTSVNKTTIPSNLYSRLSPRTIHDPDQYGRPARFSGWRHLS